MTTALIFGKIPIHRCSSLGVLHAAFHLDLRLINTKSLSSSEYSSGMILMKLGKVFFGGATVVFIHGKLLLLLMIVLGEVSFGQRVTCGRTLNDAVRLSCFLWGSGGLLAGMVWIMWNRVLSRVGRLRS
jgi:hypothetical protein